MQRLSQRLVLLAACLLLPAPLYAQPKPAFQLAAAVAVEAEEFKIEKGWKVLKNGEGNYMVDIIGFCHISGERLLSVDGKDETASAFADVAVPKAGDYRLWVRYEYPAFCETRFKVIVEQGGKKLLEQVMGTKESPRYAFGDLKPKAQHDPSWGPEGLMEEVVTVRGLQAGAARIYLKGVAQPQVAGVAANRNIDFVWLTSDTKDEWMKHYAPRTNLYPILDAFRDTIGARYEVQFTNRGSKPAAFTVSHTYNRLPWGADEGTVAKDVKPGATTDWIGLKLQDTAHYHMVTFSSGGEPFGIALRPKGGKVERTGSGDKIYRFYVPPYPGKGESIVTPVEQIDKVLKVLKENKAPGKVPTQPLCYGGWMPLGAEGEYGRKYAELYKALGMRSLHPANSGPNAMKNLEAVGIPPTKSWMVMEYRNPPTPENIKKAKDQLAKSGMGKHLLWYDYGDEIGFGEWMGMRVQHELEQAKKAGKKTTPQEITAELWKTWLQAKRPGYKAQDYWLPVWGAFDAAKLKPDSSVAAQANPKLYVDSILFYEDAAIEFAAEGAKNVRKELGDHVLCGANYSCHPFYYPHSTMYIHWFRRGAADMGRHSEYFWQVAQAGPMINGYIAEHFRAGFRYNPKGINRQYTMPHAPGNTDASFMRTAFSHLAHGAKMLDFFGIGMNESFTENHIDHRATSRYKALRDITHCIGFVEDLLPEAQVVPSQVALLVSESTERWDFAGIATDGAGHDYFGPNFRKTRTVYHLERLGLWKALTFMGLSPDLVTEEDLHDKVLKDYRFLILVGDCIPPEKAEAVEAWVRAGGVLLATAGAGRFDSYRQPTHAWQNLFGLKSRKTEEKTTFVRPRQELPFLKPIATHTSFPVFGIRDEIETDPSLKHPDVKNPSHIRRSLPQGLVIYTPTLPGMTYLWQGLQPPSVPDRGPTTHSVPAQPKGQRPYKLLRALTEFAVQPPVATDSEMVDLRLLKTGQGYLLPMANYAENVGQAVKLKLRKDVKIGKATSAFHGELQIQRKDGVCEIVIPSLGYGDILRLE